MKPFLNQSYFPKTRLFFNFGSIIMSAFQVKVCNIKIEKCRLGWATQLNLTSTALHPTQTPPYPKQNNYLWICTILL